MTASGDRDSGTDASATVTFPVGHLAFQGPTDPKPERNHVRDHEQVGLCLKSTNAS